MCHVLPCADGTFMLSEVTVRPTAEPLLITQQVLVEDLTVLSQATILVTNR